MLVRIAPPALWITTTFALLIPSAVDPDLWGHLLFGQILLEGRFPLTNDFAYTAAQHPWLNHEILAEVFMAAVYNAGGSVGLVAFKLMLALGTLGILYRTACRRSGDDVSAAVATALAAAVMLPGFMIRPQLFTLLFLASTLGVLAREDYRPRGRVFALPLLFVLWVNTHGGVLAGVALALLALGAASAVRLVRGTTSVRELAATVAVGLALVAALFVNPYGAALVRFLLHDVTPAVSISEWKPVPLGDLSFLGFKTLLVVVALGIALSRRFALPEILLVAATAVEALLHRRHIPLFVIAATPLLAVVLREGWRGVARGLEPDRAASLRRAAITAAAILEAAVAIAACVRYRGRIDVDPMAFPVQAMRFLGQNGIGGNVALPFRWGEYALWALPAGSRVAVDGRFTTAYPHPLIEEAWAFMSGGPGWDALLTDYPTDIVVADRMQAPARRLQGDPDWEYVYSDPVSVIFIRKVPSQDATLARFREHALVYDDGPLDIAFPAAPPAAECPKNGEFRAAGLQDVPPADANRCRRPAVPVLG